MRALDVVDNLEESADSSLDNIVPGTESVDAVLALAAVDNIVLETGEDLAYEAEEDKSEPAHVLKQRSGWLIFTQALYSTSSTMSNPSSNRVANNSSLLGEKKHLILMFVWDTTLWR